jgi:hypothetical protein
MPKIILNTPSLLIPKELFMEEKNREYWNALLPVSPFENIGKDDLENFFLLYPKVNDEDSIHEISVLYKKFRKKFSNIEQAICINVYEDGFNLLVLKSHKIEYTGYFCFSVKEDVLYHLANISQHFFEDIYKIVFAYQQLPSEILRLINNYYEMKKI